MVALESERKKMKILAALRSSQVECSDPVFVLITDKCDSIIRWEFGQNAVEIS